MTAAAIGTGELKNVLERKAAELARALERRDDIEIQKSADQMDEIQGASERELVIRNVDRDSHLLHQVKAALGRMGEGTFGYCIDCESAIGPKRLAAVPWAARCIRCQETADRDRQERAESLTEPLSHAA
jgi:DnaK suppressor protein